MNIKLYVISLFTIMFVNVSAQNFDKEQQYTQALNNAKLAFEAKQYSQAVVFYREAMKLKPNALLPQYKIEDIRTIYIKKEIDLLEVAEKPKTKKRQNKKELKIEQENLKKQAEIIAEKKMNNEAEKMKKELDELKTIAEKMNIDDNSEIETENIEVQDLEPNREVGLKQIDKKNSSEINYKSDKKQIIAKKREVSKSKISEKSKENKVKEKSSINSINNSEKQNFIKNKTSKKITKEWIEQENIRLAKKYPNKKTIEEIQKPQKHITRIIMNIDNKVTTYLKVKHSWGATYYFIDEVGLELRSISQIYFGRMTDLKTYETNR